MQAPISTLARGDLRSILRDSTMVLAVFGPIAIFALLLALPSIEGVIQSHYKFDLSMYRLFIVCFLSLIPTMLFGMIYGFIILDERDEDIIQFIAITPIQKQGYLSYKIQMPMLLSVGFWFLIYLGTDLVQLNPVHAIGLAILVALEAAISALFLVSFSENKVEGLAFSKLLGILYIAIPVVFLWDSPWHWITAPLPPFWIAKAFIHSQDLSAWFWFDLSMGLATHLSVLFLLIKAFLNRPS